MTNFNYDNYDDDTKAKYDDGIEFLDDDFSFDEDDDDDQVGEKSRPPGDGVDDIILRFDDAA